MTAHSPLDPPGTGAVVTIHQAKTHLSKLIARVLAGEEVTIARRDQPVVKLVAVTPLKRPNRVPGRLAHLVPPGVDVLGQGFWDPLPEDELKLWNGEGPEEEWEKGSSSTRTP
jgi:prevent-host-death family protein